MIMEMSMQLNCKTVFPYRGGDCVSGVLPRRHSVTFTSGYIVIIMLGFFFSSYSCLCFMFSAFFLNWINMVVKYLSMFS